MCWEPDACQSIARSTVQLFFAYCDRLADGVFNPEEHSGWFRELRKHRERAVDSIKATTETDVVNVAGLIAECYYAVHDTANDEDLRFWLVEAVAQVCNRFAPEKPQL